MDRSRPLVLGCALLSACGSGDERNNLEFDGRELRTHHERHGEFGPSLRLDRNRRLDNDEPRKQRLDLHRNDLGRQRNDLVP